MARPAARCNAAGLTACLALCAASVIFFTTVPQQLLPWGLSGLQSVTAPDLSAGSSAKAWKSQAATAQQSADAHAAVNLSFSIRDDKFIKDGAPFRIISGSIHYHRIPPDLWRDRLERVRALGLNAVQLYVPWNFHQPTPGPEGVLPFSGWQDLPGFISIAGELGLLVLLRPGPYICAEWEFGGFPAWLMQQGAGSSSSSMALRTSDPAYLAAVDAWWDVLLPAVAHLTYDKGGPIIMVQLENEYGYYAGDKAYLRHLQALVRRHMGEQVVLYTVDGASSLPLAMGSLPGSEVLATVDFGPTADVAAAFALQKRFNPPGKSPPFCVEYYTGWLTHWGEPMANTTAAAVAKTLREILEYGNGTGSVNLYMAAGGTNFGPWAGANVFASLVTGKEQQEQAGPEQWRLQQYQHQQQKQQRAVTSSSSSAAAKEWYQPHITSYDYSCPVGESGTVGQVGIGGNSKFDGIRAVVAAAQGLAVEELPQLPAPVPVQAYEPVVLSEGLYVLDALAPLSNSCRNSSYCSKQRQQAVQHPSEADLVVSRQHRAASQRPSWAALQRLLSSLPDAGSVAAATTSSTTTHGRSELRQTSADSSAHVGAVVSSSAYPLPMEQYGQYYGLIVYETQLSGPQAGTAGGTLQFVGHDTVWVFLEGRLIGSSYRSAPATIQVPPSPFIGSDEIASDNTSKHQRTAESTVASSRELLQQLSRDGAEAAKYASSVSVNDQESNGRLLQLLVWPMGRNNFGAFGGSMLDPKGLVSNVTLSGTVLSGWTVHHLCLQGGGPDSFSNLKLPWRPLAPGGMAAEAGGAGMSWRHQHGRKSSRAELQDRDGVKAAAGMGKELQPLVLPGVTKQRLQQQQQRLGGSAGLVHASNITAFISTVAEAQAQAVIAAAADAASGSGPATVAARAAANIRAGWAAAAAADASMNVAPDGKGPLLLRGTLHVPSTTADVLSNPQDFGTPSAKKQQAARPADTFLHIGEVWGRGEVWVNGHSLGRYWAAQGPQMSLYLPGSFLQPGPNEVVVLELEGKVPIVPGQPLGIVCQAQPDFAGPAAGPAPLS